MTSSSPTWGGHGSRDPGGPGVRADTAVLAGYKMPSFYDSMVGKLIIHGANRDEA